MSDDRVVALVSDTVFTGHREVLAPLDDRVIWLRSGRDGVVDEDGAPVARPRPDVAFGSADMLYDGVAAPFFEVVLGCPSMRWFHSATAGSDHPAFRPLLERGVRVSTAHENRIAIAEFVLRAVLDVFQGADAWRTAQAERAWRHHEVREVLGTTWLVVGLGSIGTEVATRATAFGASVVGVRRRAATGDEPVERVVTPDRILAELPGADVVVLSAPGTSGTRHLVDEAFLAAMRPGSVLVNVARGSLVDEAALGRALDRGVPERAVLDVFDPEPLDPESPLWSHPRVVVTPHNAAAGSNRHRRNAQLFAANVARFLAGEPIPHELHLADLDAGTATPAQFTGADDPS